MTLLIIGCIFFCHSSHKESISGQVQTINPTTYINGKVQIFPLKIQFSKPVAKLELLDKTIRSANIKIFPTIVAEWIVTRGIRHL
ncbi:MAG: hypothetical protein IJY58_02030 [Alphaproteobacteria bacterium]|nr:hypothetical protein [Alphaproteobacteria bacterium]